jgi:hypothetical protein
MRSALHRVLVTALLVAAVAGCGSGSPEEEPAAVAPSERASPFAVDWVPDGVELSAAGRGQAEFRWVDDEVGGMQPYVGLVRVGEGPGPRTAAVRKVGYSPELEGVDQAFGCGDDGEDIREVLGAETLYCRNDGREPTPIDPWLGVLTVDRGDGDAFTIVAERAARAQLEPLVRWVGPWTDDAAAPVVDPASGYRSVARSNGDVVIAQGAYTGEPSDHVPGPTSGFTLGWTDGASRSITAVALAGTSGNARLAAGGISLGWEHLVPIPVPGGDAYVVRRSSGALDLVRSTPWGDLVVVGVEGFGEPRDEEVARRVGANLRRVSDDEWAQTVASAGGGPGLHPDVGQQEILRGTEAGEEWLVQTGEFGPASIGMGVDPCVKVTGRRRVCPWVQSGTGVRLFDAEGAAPLPPFAMLVVKDPRATALVVRTADGDRRVDLAPLPEGSAPLPDGSSSVAVVFGITENPSCWQEDPAVRVDMVDAQGDVIGCLGEPGAGN